MMPLTRPGPVTSPFTRPLPVTRPLTRPAGAVRPFTRPIPFTSPLVRPTPFTNPFVRPTPFTSPFTRPFPFTMPLTLPDSRGPRFGRSPLTSPRLPRTHWGRAHGHLRRHGGAALRSLSLGFGDHPVELGDLLIPGHVVEEGARRGPESRRVLGSLEMLRLEAELSDLDLLRIRCFRRGAIKGGDRLIRLAKRFEQETPRVPQLRIVGLLREATVVEQAERRRAFPRERVSDVLLHLLFVEGRAALDASGRECGRDALTERTFVFRLRDRFLRLLGRCVI